ncbi:YfiT family bacillithiol transferase [Acidipila rosea]|uniref:DinB family protein n=1 Tax=Acidipila rosea TaxID=768535 RepID=A0A4R1L7Q6_9BACT|nr:putative metal-dependent hydrolase [Acidipila rosea]MBW4027242.1 putative metal-dependent hydrolase [Acidobacteriota bacterium]MBW4046170.1 putative metal-dependent hydrolase [Acidobacteriota bacterium]TCK74252.1 DinB family protein [Acidipila rosea]
MSTAPSIDPLRYPIGRFQRPADLTAHDRTSAIHSIAALPENLRSAVSELTEAQLDTPYREGGWTVRQVVHHVADSHINAYARIRLALTEDWPAITPYKENLWAELPDARTAPVDVSLELLESLHRRLALLLSALDEQAWHRGYTHPVNGPQPLNQVIALYDWHGRHHVAQISTLRKRSGW